MNGFITTTVGLTDYLLYQEGLQGIQMVPILYQGSSPSSICLADLDRPTCDATSQEISKMIFFDDITELNSILPRRPFSVRQLCLSPLSIDICDPEHQLLAKCRISLT